MIVASARMSGPPRSHRRYGWCNDARPMPIAGLARCDGLRAKRIAKRRHADSISFPQHSAPFPDNALRIPPIMRGENTTVLINDFLEKWDNGARFYNILSIQGDQKVSDAEVSVGEESGGKLKDAFERMPGVCLGTSLRSVFSPASEGRKRLEAYCALKPGEKALRADTERLLASPGRIIFDGDVFETAALSADRLYVFAEADIRRGVNTEPYQLWHFAETPTVRAAVVRWVIAALSQHANELSQKQKDSLLALRSGFEHNRGIGIGQYPLNSTRRGFFDQLIDMAQSHIFHRSDAFPGLDATVVAILHTAFERDLLEHPELGEAIDRVMVDEWKAHPYLRLSQAMENSGSRTLRDFATRLSGREPGTEPVNLK
jgi:hypothetical protein